MGWNARSPGEYRDIGQGVGEVQSVK